MPDFLAKHIVFNLHCRSLGDFVLAGIAVENKHAWCGRIYGDAVHLFVAEGHMQVAWSMCAKKHSDRLATAWQLAKDRWRASFMTLQAPLGSQDFGGPFEADMPRKGP